MKNFDKITKAYALKNAISHEGKVSQGSVISALFNEGLKKQEVKTYIKKISEIITKINNFLLKIKKKNLNL